MDGKYKLRYLTLAYLDLQDIVDYVCNELSAPDAANDLVDKFDEAISRLEMFPFSGPICYNINGLKDEYRFLVVENYIFSPRGKKREQHENYYFACQKDEAGHGCLY
ncbi:type II toxin-antitoxin system RelE/ParE family toxin [Paenibacillus sp. FSL M7-1046]|uniref:type II toxin-antitoxin system RelE/ParE family toxin n=1 Tax=Paenibacillus sp. FSL M7-1046 TaxID=2975315 RepID=UPI0030F5637D